MVSENTKELETSTDNLLYKFFPLEYFFLFNTACIGHFNNIHNCTEQD